jgi:hypothetical protein
MTPKCKTELKSEAGKQAQEKERNEGCRRGVGGGAEVVWMADGNGGW